MNNIKEAAIKVAKERWPVVETWSETFKNAFYIKRAEFVAGAEWALGQGPSDAEQGYAAMDALGCELRVVENGGTTCDLHGGYATENDVCEVVAMTLSAARDARQEWR